MYLRLNKMEINNKRENRNKCDCIINNNENAAVQFIIYKYDNDNYHLYFCKFNSINDIFNLKSISF
jgi:hypothetical protein